MQTCRTETTEVRTWGQACADRGALAAGWCLYSSALACRHDPFAMVTAVAGVSQPALCEAVFGFSKMRLLCWWTVCCLQVKRVV